MVVSGSRYSLNCFSDTFRFFCTDLQTFCVLPSSAVSLIVQLAKRAPRDDRNKTGRRSQSTAYDPISSSLKSANHCLDRYNGPMDSIYFNNNAVGYCYYFYHIKELIQSKQLKIFNRGSRWYCNRCGHWKCHNCHSDDMANPSLEKSIQIPSIHIQTSQ